VIDGAGKGVTKAFEGTVPGFTGEAKRSRRIGTVPGKINCLSPCNIKRSDEQPHGALPDARMVTEIWRKMVG